MTPEIGQQVDYVAFAGDRWPAVVTAIREGGLVDIDVILPNTEDRLSVHAVRWFDGAAHAGWDP